MAVQTIEARGTATSAIEQAVSIALTDAFSDRTTPSATSLPRRTFIAHPTPEGLFTARRFSGPDMEGHTRSSLIDFDSDGDLDVLVEGQSSFVEFGPRPFLLFGNEGNGIFSQFFEESMGPSTPLYMNFREMAVADFNGDGRMDIFLANQGFDEPPFPGAPNLLFIQDERGRLVDESESRLPINIAFTHGVTAGDIDLDGDIDIYACNLKGPGVGPSFSINDGNGYFTDSRDRIPLSIANLMQVYKLCRLVDLDLDGDLDLVLGRLGGGNSGNWAARDTILINDGMGYFEMAPEDSLPPRIGGPDWGVLDIKAADFDSDGWPDLIMLVDSSNKSSEAGKQKRNPKIQLLLSNHDGTFRDASDQLPETIDGQCVGGHTLDRILPGDYDSDGDVDFIAVNTECFGGNALYVNAGSANFEIDKKITGQLTRGLHRKAPFILAGDLDNDGDLDLVLIGPKNYHEVFINNSQQ